MSQRSLSLDEAMNHALTDEGRAEVAARLRGLGQPLYASDSARPGSLIRRNPDGTTTRGQFVNRIFVADDSPPSR
jgi:hypothetical protein